MAIRIGSNIASLMTQRKLAQSSEGLARTFERLASGLRINRASDDAAGLALSTNLNLQARLYGQAQRNVNDTQSLLNVADGALQQLSAIVVRQKELAEQAANGTYSTKQRLALTRESIALTDEYNRITNSTSFNDINVLAYARTFSAQIGIGSSDALSLDLGSQLARTVGSGTFRAGSNVTTATGLTGVTLADVNNDGRLDMIGRSESTSNISVALGKGDGTFQSEVTYAAGAFSNNNKVEIATLDVNRDGKLDIVAMDSDLAGTNSSVSVFLGNGTGSFGPRIVTNLGTQDGLGLVPGDFNGDGVPDLMATASSGPTRLLLGNGNGTFTVSTPLTIAFYDGDADDVNGDGKLDFIGAASSGSVVVALGNGDGSFSTAQQINLAGNPLLTDAKVLDANNDGIKDLVVADWTIGAGGIWFAPGNGNGTFGSGNYISSGRVYTFTSGDVNNDGLEDLGFLNTTNINFSLINNGRGGFTTSLIGQGSNGDLAFGDLNGDGAQDVILANFGITPQVFIANTVKSTSASYVDLSTAEAALDALDVLSAAAERIGAELGAVGAMQSRLEFSWNLLAAQRENVLAAASRIRDADIAAESAELARLGILQQAATAILAHANQEPALVLKLLGN